MKNFLKLCFIFTAMTFVSSVLANQKIDTSRFENFVILKPVNIKTAKVVKFTTNSFPSGITLLLDENEKVIPHRFISKWERISKDQKIKIEKVSSTLEGIKENLIDNDLKTTFSFETEKDQEKKVLLTFPEKIEISGIEIFTDLGIIPPKKISVRGDLGNGLINILDNVDYAAKIPFPTISLVKLEISFQTPHFFRLREIEILGGKDEILNQQEELLFFAENEKEYKLFFKAHFGQKEYKAKFTQPLQADQKTPIFSFPLFEKNPDFDFDFDGDGLEDDLDLCPKTADQNNTDFDQNGRGDVCEDPDLDQIFSLEDNCPFVYNPAQKDQNLNQIGDLCEDSDNDGIEANQDNCLYKANPQQLDSDGDNIGDLCDNCPHISNSNQKDVNDNGIGDLCEDSDNDGLKDAEDNCPQVKNKKQNDSDEDGIGDLCDNCPQVKNPSQKDSDKNEIGDICDDQDGDGIASFQDNCPQIKNPDQKDQNQNLIGDACEDDDGDGILNQNDNCPFKINYQQNDKDNDGIGDACDETEDRWTEKNPILLWIIMSFIILFLGFIMWRVSKKS